jgi:four helix bundle protein
LDRGLGGRLIGELTTRSNTPCVGVITLDSTLDATVPAMQDTRNLRVAEHAERLALAVYRLTAAFPHEERFGLSQQMRRAAVSVGSNIAEGCGRRGNRELLNHLYIAMASGRELEFQLGLTGKLAFGAESERSEVSAELNRVQRMLNRLTAYLRAQPAWRRNEGAPRSERPTL